MWQNDGETFAQHVIRLCIVHRRNIVINYKSIIDQVIEKCTDINLKRNKFKGDSELTMNKILEINKLYGPRDNGNQRRSSYYDYTTE